MLRGRSYYDRLAAKIQPVAPVPEASTGPVNTTGIAVGDSVRLLQSHSKRARRPMRVLKIITGRYNIMVEVEDTTTHRRHIAFIDQFEKIVPAS